LEARGAQYSVIRNRNLRKIRGGHHRKFSVHQHKAPTHLGCGFKAEQMALNCVLEFSITFLWPQDRPPDEMSEEKETRVCFENKNGRDRAQLGVDYCIHLPLPQDRPLDEKNLQGWMREEDKKGDRFEEKNERVGAQLGVDYRIFLPWPQDRPPR